MQKPKDEKISLMSMSKGVKERIAEGEREAEVRVKMSQLCEKNGIPFNF
jgi:hypothetical protein